MSLILRQRILVTAVLAAALLGVTAWRRGPSDADRAQLDRFWARKMSWHRAAGCVIAGDSRAGRGVVPATLATLLPNTRVLNFAFDSAGFSAEYLDAAGAVIDPSAPTPTVLLAITPFSLTRFAVQANEFETQRRLLTSHLGTSIRDSLDRLAPMRIDRVAREFAGRRCPPPVTDRIYHSDGWVEMLRDTGNESVYVQKYRDNFRDNAVDPDVVRSVLEHVAAWSRSGIRVIAFRPPAAAPIRAVEDQLSGFDEPAFAEAVARSGGVWLAIAPDGYVTYDGSHLGRAEALRFSAELRHRLATLSDGYRTVRKPTVIAQNPRDGGVE